MKLFAALFALIFSTSAQAATYSYEFKAVFTQESLRWVFDEDGVPFPDQSITVGNNPYSFSGGHWYEQYRDGLPTSGRLTVETGSLPGTLSLLECYIGGFNCISSTTVFGTADNDMVSFNQYSTGWGLLFLLGPDGGSASFDIDQLYSNGMSPEGKVLYGRLNTIRFDLEPIPVPASGVLLIGALGLSGWAMRRARSARRSA